MRCKCCDAPNARRWKGEYYCAECRGTVSRIIKEDNDDNAGKYLGMPELVHTRWDEE